MSIKVCKVLLFMCIRSSSVSDSICVSFSLPTFGVLCHYHSNGLVFSYFRSDTRDPNTVVFIQLHCLALLHRMTEECDLVGMTAESCDVVQLEVRTSFNYERVLAERIPVTDTMYDVKKRLEVTMECRAIDLILTLGDLELQDTFSVDSLPKASNLTGGLVVLGVLRMSPHWVRFHCFKRRDEKKELALTFNAEVEKQGRAFLAKPDAMGVFKVEDTGAPGEFTFTSHCLLYTSPSPRD